MDVNTRLLQFGNTLLEYVAVSFVKIKNSECNPFETKQTENKITRKQII